ncbi:MAG: hypothetical protein RJA36_1452 [Pseudomonadota bacterium]|jgi:hypothetical protein
MFTPIAAIVGAAGTPGTPPTPELICVGETIRIRSTDPSSVTFNPVVNDITNDGAEVSLIDLDPLPAARGTIGRVGNAVTYSRAPGFADTFSFNYRARSETGALGEGTITVIVEGTTTVAFVRGVADTLDIELAETTKDFDILANDEASGPLEIAAGSIVQPTGGPTLSIVGGKLRVTRGTAGLATYSGGSYRPRLVDGSILGDAVPLTVRVVSASVTAPDFTVVVPIDAPQPFVIDALARCTGTTALELSPAGLTPPTGASDTAAIVAGKINYTRSTTAAGVYTMTYKARLIANPAIEDVGTITIRVAEKWWLGRALRGNRSWAAGIGGMGARSADWVRDIGQWAAYSAPISRPGVSDLTWEGIWGGLDTEAPSAVTIQPNSQPDFFAGELGEAARGITPESAFLFAHCELFPAAFANTGGATDVRIWDLIDGGTLDAGYVRMGARLKKAYRSLGWWDDDLFVLVLPVANSTSSPICRVYTATATRYQTALQRVIAKLREGWGGRLRIAQQMDRQSRPAAITSWVPKNAAGGVDMIGMRFRPNSLVTSQATYDQFLRKWDTASYGMLDDVIPAAETLAVPLVALDWAPVAVTGVHGSPCPAADIAVEQWSKLLRAQARAKNLVAEAMSGGELLSATAYGGTDTAGSAAWGRAVTDIKGLWKGAPLSPIPSLTVADTAVTLSGDSVDVNVLASATPSTGVGIKRIVSAAEGLATSIVGSGAAARVRVARGTSPSGIRVVIPELALSGIAYLADGQIIVTIPSAPGDVDTSLFRNPFNRWSAHHRPIGAGVQFGIPDSVTAANIGSTNPAHYTGGDPGGRGRLGTLPIKLDLEDSKVGTKYYWECVAGRITTTAIKFYRTVAGKEVLQETVNVGVPDPGRFAFYPEVPAGSKQDFQVLFYRKGAGTADMLQTIRGFNFAESRGIYPMKEWPLGGMDAPEPGSPGDTGTSASRMRWPMGFLRGFEINDNSILTPIGHCLQASVARQYKRSDGTGAPPATQVLGRRNVWPSYGQDDSADSDPDDNNGDIPYGALLTLKTADYNSIMAALPASNNRGRRIVDAIYFYGIYVVDGNGSQNSIQLRVDANVGYEPDPTVTTGARPGCKPLTGVRDNINAALALCQSKLWPVYNPQTYGTTPTIRQVWTDGLPYVGGGGPRDPLRPEMSKNTAYDLAA